MTKRIVITGMGWITPLGHDIETVWSKMLDGASGVSPIEHFDASTFPTTFAAQVKDYDWRGYVADASLHEGIGRNTAYALGAASQAWRAAGFTGPCDDDNAGRCGIYLGSGEGVIDFDHFVQAHFAGWDEDAKAVRPAAFVPKAREVLSDVGEREQEPNMPLAHIAMEFNAQGPAFNCLTACAASTQAIGEAMTILQHGDADVMITGGAHTMIHPFGLTGFNRLTALSNRNDDPATASRPFSADRDGFVLGEGASVLILGTLEHCQARGATERIVAEVVGYGSTADASRITDMQPEGRGAAAAMRQAMAMVGVTTADIDYISAHGTGTKENDSVETKAIKAVFAPPESAPQATPTPQAATPSEAASERPTPVGCEGGGPAAETTPAPSPPTPTSATSGHPVPPVSSVKSMLGHLIAAAGATEAIVCALAIRDHTLPPHHQPPRPGPHPGPGLHPQHPPRLPQPRRHPEPRPRRPPGHPYLPLQQLRLRRPERHPRHPTLRGLMPFRIRLSIYTSNSTTIYGQPIDTDPQCQPETQLVPRIQYVIDQCPEMLNLP